MTKQIAILAALSLAVSGCCTLFPGTYGQYERCLDPHRYDSGWTHEFAGAWTGPKTLPRCVSAVEAALVAHPPCERAQRLFGVVRWHEKPFDCMPPFGHMVWGCSTLGKAYVSVDVALPPNGHAADSALPEEAAHWVWQVCHPEVTVTEGWKPPDEEHPVKWYWRDPAFKAWFDTVIAESKAACP